MSLTEVHCELGFWALFLLHNSGVTWLLHAMPPLSPTPAAAVWPFATSADLPLWNALQGELYSGQPSQCSREGSPPTVTCLVCPNTCPVFQGNLGDLGKLLMQGSFSVWTDHKKGHTKVKELARFKPMQRHLFLHEKAVLFCKKREENGEGYEKAPSYSYKQSLNVSDSASNSREGSVTTWCLISLSL